MCPVGCKSRILKIDSTVRNRSDVLRTTGIVFVLHINEFTGTGHILTDRQNKKIISHKGGKFLEVLAIF